MERRVLLAIFLSFLVLYVYQAFIVPPAPKPAGVATAPGAARPATPPPTAPSQPATPDQPAEMTPPATTLVGDASERDIRFETPNVIAVFTNRGGRLKSWRLKHFLDPRQEPLELVANDLAASEPLPFSLRVPDTATTARLNGALYKQTGPPNGGVTESTRAHVRFEYSDSTGIHAVKDFEVDSATYTVTFRATVTQNDQALLPAIVWGPALADASGSDASRLVKRPEGLLFLNGKVERLAPDDIATQSVYEGDFRLAGVDDLYFMTAAVDPGPAKISYRPVSIPPPEGSEAPPRDLMAYDVEPSRGDSPVKFFVGPKDFDVLVALDREFVRAIDFGMFSLIVVPLLRSLNWIHDYVGNYGWSIVILTVLINALMFPLRHKSVVSMRRMQDLQPEVKAIQDRYSKLKATDPAKQKMNQELMALYKERGVNPASGCVPMLLTLPVLYAFYSLLSTAIELRGAPFFGWIHDLSQYDPLYVTPVLMGASQMWQTKMTPQTGADPAQQKLMMFMPIMFTFFFLWAPSGVAIYWFVSNLWGIGQQYLTNYLIGPPAVHNVRPAAERRVKRVGSGKTGKAAREPQEDPAPRPS